MLAGPSVAGRLEVHVEVGLPDLSGRQQVFRVHTAPLLTHGALGRDVDLWELARRSQNFTGAEIEGVVKVRAGRAPVPSSFPYLLQVSHSVARC